MRLIIKLIFMINVFFFSMSVYSIGTYGTVERIYPNNEKVSFRLKGDVCKSKDLNSYWSFDLGSETSKAWLSMLIAASATGSIIKLGVDECDPEKDANIVYLYQDF